ncbi:TetR/AcrR family transcriptional regulator [Pengzhenrongella phosphoraccumulans]|uniref:TetR/AcrR family transcriptional regulator n=1 Tax=Pengzhenrongella phosphoraccumulans TaxID=3114394 RepID=UPI003890B480
MPRITAPTVAEHRTRQRVALLAAATELLVSQGAGAVTPGAVGAAAGLARPSVYQYFSSGADLLAAVVEDAFPQANADLRTALERSTDPADRLDIYVRTTLRLARDGAHRAVAALAAAPLPEQCRARLAELHREQAAPLLAALQDLEVPDPALTAQLLGGALRAAMAALDAGCDFDAVTERTLALVRATTRTR